MTFDSAHQKKMNGVFKSAEAHDEYVDNWTAGTSTNKDKYNAMISNSRYLDKTAVKLKKELFQKVIFENSRVLDCGCGTGYYLNFIKRNLDVDFDLVGIDISRTDIQKAANPSLNKTHLGMCDAELLPFKDESFDVVLSLATIEHVISPENYLEECFRVLRRGGKLGFFIHKPFIDPLIIPSLMMKTLQMAFSAKKQQKNEERISFPVRTVRDISFSFINDKIRIGEMKLIERKSFIYSFEWTLYKKFFGFLIPTLISFGSRINRFKFEYYKNFEYYVFRKI
jgi:ubiquinone/menaquinone biosynthesis C-methylase UbiE